MRRGGRVGRVWATNYIERHIWGKWHQVRVVRRFLLVWCAVVVLAVVGLTEQLGGLSRVTQALTAVRGGTYTEAAVGSVSTLNPLLPEPGVSDDINRLIFSGLTRYNLQRQIVPDLATSWSVSTDGLTYTFQLRHGVKWQDGVPFTSADVAFTLTAIQNPDSRSPLASSWQGVKVDTRGDYVVVFTLPTPLTSFLDSTTLEIVPRHLLESVDPSGLREASFNQSPVGTGPFELRTFAPSAHEVALVANPSYYDGRAALDGFTFRLYGSEAAALDAYAQHQVISPGMIAPDELVRRQQLAGLTDYSYTLPDETTLFFQTADATLGDKGLRQILVQSLDRGQVAAAATASQGLVVTQPILPGQLGYTTKYALAQRSAAQTEQALAAAGWVAAKPGAVRQKAGRPLSLRLVTLRGSELEQAAAAIKRQWAPLGIGVQVVATDLTTLQQTYMRPRNFQLLLFGVNIGADPDVYPFWHSSQAKDPGLNLSGYSSPTADAALEAGRIKTDPQVRQGKYDTFLKAWNDDAPAAVLYETSYDYATSDEVGGVAGGRLVEPSDRFYGVEHWTARRLWESVR